MPVLRTPLAKKSPHARLRGFAPVERIRDSPKPNVKLRLVSIRRMPLHQSPHARLAAASLRAAGISLNDLQYEAAFTYASGIVYYKRLEEALVQRNKGKGLKIVQNVRFALQGDMNKVLGTRRGLAIQEAIHRRFMPKAA